MYEKLDNYRAGVVKRRVFERWQRYKYICDVKREKYRLADLFRQSQRKAYRTKSPIKPRKGSAIDLNYPLMNLAFSGWRALALKQRNVKHIVTFYNKGLIFLDPEIPKI